MVAEDAARTHYLVGRQNTLPLYVFDAMNSGASRAIYALFGAVFVTSFVAVALIFVGARRQSLSRAVSQPPRARPEGNAQKQSRRTAGLQAPASCGSL
jgi:hypothetical protein